MKKRIFIADAWGKVRGDRKGVFVELIDGKGNKFLYMPTYEDMDEINKALAEVEELNKDKKISNNQKQKGGGST